jgi:phosphoribosylformylglycinamidine synthase
MHPGGFSYGDDIGAGVIFSRQLRGRIGDAIADFLQADKLVLGICNGFQVLLKAGILPDGSAALNELADKPAPATLTWNDNGKYTAMWVGLEVASKTSVFLRGIDSLQLPIAHGEGKLVVREPSLVDRWRENQQVALCYRAFGSNGTGQSKGSCKPPLPSREGLGEGLNARNFEMASGELPQSTTLPFPDNPNGSIGNIAGLSDPSGRVLGLMPHPERFLHATQHPQWTRLGLKGEGQGMRLFRNAVEYFG